MAKLKTFLVEIILFVCFLFFGAAVFQVLEQRNESLNIPGPNSTEILSSVIHRLSQKYNISTDELNSTVKQLRTSIRNHERKWVDWSFTGSYYFAGTIAFTIGFGHQTPKTSLGRLTVIFYALLAIPMTALLLSACGEKMAEQQESVVIFIETQLFKRTPTHLKLKSIILHLFILALFFIIAILLGKYYYDGWTILEGFYFLWILYTTVGFGDYIVNNGKPYYDGQPFKTFMLRINILLLVIGLCQVSCILVSIQNTLEEKVLQKVGSTQKSESADEETNEEKKDDVLANTNEACDIELENTDARLENNDIST